MLNRKALVQASKSFFDPQGFIGVAFTVLIWLAGRHMITHWPDKGLIAFGLLLSGIATVTTWMMVEDLIRFYKDACWWIKHREEQEREEEDTIEEDQ